MVKNVNQSRHDGITPLYILHQKKGHIDIVKLLLESGANINQSRNSEQPLYILHHNKDIEILLDYC